MTPQRRQRLLIGLFLACAALVGYDRLKPAAPAAVVGAAPAKAAQRGAAPAAPQAARKAEPQQIAPLRPRADFAAAGGNAFPAVLPPAPVRPAAEPVAVAPPKPTAPPLPFTVLGKKLENGAWEVYIARGDQTWIASPGTLIDNDYRVEQIGPGSMSLTYLPLNEKQTLQTGGSFQ
jgi:hypothetical protein